MAADAPDSPHPSIAAPTISDAPAGGVHELADGRKKRGRPRKITSHPETPAVTSESKRRGRPPKLKPETTPTEKKKRGRRPKSTLPPDSSSVFIIPQAKQLKADIFQNYPGAAAIIVPKSLLAEKAGKSSIVISPKMIQSLIDASTGKRKRGRPRSVGIKKKPEQSSQVAKRRPGRPRKNAVVLNQELVGARDGQYSSESPIVKGPGRPWKIRDIVVPGNEVAVRDSGVNSESINGTEELRLPESIHGTENAAILNVKKRSVGRPRKKPID